MGVYAAGLPTGNLGNLEYLAKWAVEVESKLRIPQSASVLELSLRICVVIHHGHVTAGTVLSPL